MIGNASFRRKVMYGVLMAVLLIPLSYLSRPSSRQPDGSVSGGGILSQMRAQNRLSQAELGDIDPTSESMKLATLGMRGIAANLLWERAHKFKREQDWDSLSATLNQISKLQPNFLSVWQFQGWNLAYNVSIEFDDYRSRYHWVKKGTDFLREGVRHNRQEPVLLWELGWTFGHKLGKADEYVQFRRLFAEDEDYHDVLSEDINMDDARGYNDKPDNWLAGREWFLRAEQIIDSGVAIRGRLLDDTGRIKRGKTPLIFHSNAPKWIMNYATAIQEEGILGEVSQLAWRRAGVEWNEYGNRPIESALEGFAIRLNDVGLLQRSLNDSQMELIQLAENEFGADLQAQIQDEKKKSLTQEEREALDTPVEDRTDEEWSLVNVANRKIEVTPQEIADRCPPNVRRKAQGLARRLAFTKAKLDTTVSYQNQVAYPYWKTRCEIEQTDRAIRARKYVFEADKLIDEAALWKMEELYEKAWTEWAAIYEAYPNMIESPDAEDIYDAILRYKFVLEKMEKPWPPKGFKLNQIMMYYDETFKPHPDDVAADQAGNSNSEAGDAEVDSSSDATQEDSPADEDATARESTNTESAEETDPADSEDKSSDDKSSDDQDAKDKASEDQDGEDNGAAAEDAEEASDESFIPDETQQPDDTAVDATEDARD